MDNKTVKSLHFDDNVYTSIKALAVLQHITVSELVELALLEYIRVHEFKLQPAPVAKNV
jgi:hypothetical protein